MNGTERFDSALYAVCDSLRRPLLFLPDTVKRKTAEIRLRRGLPIALTVDGRPLFLRKDGTVADYLCRDLLIADGGELEESFRLLCQKSVYAHAAELRNGFIMMQSGHRAGVCGTLNENGTMQDISSLNIRIAREVYGCADMPARYFDGGGMLIAGPPGSGKTTVLRDLIRQLSDGICGTYYRIVAVDSRGELSGSCEGMCMNDLGKNTDVLLTAQKSVGMEIAVRTMFPDIVAFDEIGTADELAGVAESFNAGVSVITTAHVGKADDLLRRSVTSSLLHSGAIRKIALLDGSYRHIEMLSAKELLCRVDH